MAIGRSVLDLPVNTSCTYRVMSTCGYPQAEWRVNDPKIAGDFDIAYATVDGLVPTNELDGWEFNYKTDWTGSYATNVTLAYTPIRHPKTPDVGDEQWSKCNGVIRNLYVTVTRVKDSNPPQTQQQMRTKRQLQFFPNGTKFADIDIVFSSYRGEVKNFPKI
jgi:hypothetical protein